MTVTTCQTDLAEVALRHEQLVRRGACRVLERQQDSGRHWTLGAVLWHLLGYVS